MDENEALEDAAARELQEETSVEPSSVVLRQVRWAVHGQDLDQPSYTQLGCLVNKMDVTCDLEAVLVMTCTQLCMS